MARQTTSYMMKSTSKFKCLTNPSFSVRTSFTWFRIRDLEIMRFVTDCAVQPWVEVTTLQWPSSRILTLMPSASNQFGHLLNIPSRGGGGVYFTGREGRGDVRSKHSWGSNSQFPLWLWCHFELDFGSIFIMTIIDIILNLTLKGVMATICVYIPYLFFCRIYVVYWNIDLYFWYTWYKYVLRCTGVVINVSEIYDRKVMYETFKGYYLQITLC